jgi:hypothetical protein
MVTGGGETSPIELKPVVASSAVNARGPRCGTARAFCHFGRFLSSCVCVCVRARAERGVEPASERLLVGCAVDLWS